MKNKVRQLTSQLLNFGTAPDWATFSGTRTCRLWAKEAALLIIPGKEDGSYSLTTYDGAYRLTTSKQGIPGWGIFYRADDPYASGEFRRFTSARNVKEMRSNLITAAVRYRYEMEMQGALSVDWSPWRVGAGRAGRAA